MDSLATNLVKGVGGGVGGGGTSCDGSRLIHGMNAAEHMRFFQCITRQAEVLLECSTAGPGGRPLYAGKMYSLEPTERGTLQVVHVEGGFFN